MNNVAQSLLDLPRTGKRVLVMAIDILLCIGTVWLAMSLRFEHWAALNAPLTMAASVATVLALPLFVVTGLYRAIFRYSGLPALMSVIRAVGVYALAYITIFGLVGVQGVPRSIAFLQPLLLLVAVGGSRMLAWIWLGGHYQRLIQRCDIPRVLVFGAGSAGRQLVGALHNSPEMEAVAFLDDDASLHGQILKGLKIHDPAKLPELVERLQIDLVLLAIPSASRQRRNEIVELASQAHVQVRTLPGIMELANGEVHVSDLRELEIEDLLGRDPVPPQPHLLDRNLRGKVVLVTGAGGSIGSELCRQIIQSGPAQLLLLELNEYALYKVNQDLEKLQAEGLAHQVELTPLLGSVQNAERLREIMRTWQPHTVYHAAAYKHVPLVEHNPAEGVKNNVFGTLLTAQVAAEQGVEDFVLVSTDKAVRPTNIMGTSKRLAEMALQALAADPAQAANTRFSMVRFGNVLGSSGSVVPLFRQQIKDGGPITLTHADITRYFMTIPEAAQLVIQAGAMATGGDVFVLDMGEPVKIIDLARRMVELSGLSIKDANNPGGDIELKINGLRPGEKLYEELLIGDNPLPTQHPRIMKAHEDFLHWSQLALKLKQLQQSLAVNDVPEIRNLLKELVPGYQPEGDVVDWVHIKNTVHA
ncbi:polysaccharide biosynthesis protein [Malikia spinosa]|uniref:Polysaccharide biosynthesis protein n=2 Tax=Malikia spinosa TaxID=86180 RepID=A0A2S9KA51_9BURK|nr:polysaccharide biosynthesis protein [Malikia spinosa]